MPPSTGRCARVEAAFFRLESRWVRYPGACSGFGTQLARSNLPGSACVSQAALGFLPRASEAAARRRSQHPRRVPVCRGGTGRRSPDQNWRRWYMDFRQCPGACPGDFCSKGAPKAGRRVPSPPQIPTDLLCVVPGAERSPRPTKKPRDQGGPAVTAPVVSFRRCRTSRLARQISAQGERIGRRRRRLAMSSPMNSSFTGSQRSLRPSVITIWPRLQTVAVR